LDSNENDLDNLVLDLIIVAKNVGPMNQAAGFLIRRGWHVRIFNSIPAAIEQISFRRPNFVLLSVNHPNPNILKFPQAVGSTFKVECVAFAETGDASAAARVASMSCPHKIQGLPTGPNLLRAMRGIVTYKVNEGKSGAAPADDLSAVMADLSLHFQNEIKQMVPAMPELPNPALLISDQTEIQDFLAPVKTGPVVLAPVKCRIGVVPVKSSNMNGYMTVVMDRTVLDDRFLNACHVELSAQFRRSGLQGELEAGFWLDLPSMDFEAWAKSKALFHFNFEHQGVNVQAAFFPYTRELVLPKPSKRDNMFTLDVKDISTEVPIPFKAYLYLEKNKKYFLYLRNGRTLQPGQKERLLKTHSKALWLKEIDVPSVKKMQAETFLLDMIKDPKAAA
jgi:hypothetical protein